MQVGDVFSWERSFTVEEIDDFSRLSGDAGTHHITPDTHGRLLVHGLLTATLPTKIGGDLNFIARDLAFQFHRPVFAGDTIRCTVTILEYEEQERYTALSVGWVCRNQEDQEVMTGQGHGVVRR